MAYLILREYWRAQTRRLELEQKSAPKQIAALEDEKKQLEARIQNLESIVCSVDFELNQRLSRLAAAQAVEAEAPPKQVAAPGRGSISSPGASGGVAVAVRSASAAHAAVSAAIVEATAPTAVLSTEARTNYKLGVLTGGQVVLGRYTVEREIGRGGMGAVYVARDAKLGEKVALKVISSVYAGDPEEAAERFRHEVQAARMVSHPNVIRIHDLGEDGPLLFLSMEYVDGETLWSRVKAKGPLPVPQAKEILCAIASGVAAAHSAGVVHRDLKPQNVLLGSGGRVVKVIDFGLAKSSFQAGQTATGIIQGTPEYMAPEQVRGLACDARTDVYALGATAYYALTGRPPFQGDTPIAIGFAQVHDKARPPRELRPEIPAPLEAAILKALDKDPAVRPSDAEEWRKQVAG